MAAPSDNVLYVAELRNWRVQKLMLRPRKLPEKPGRRQRRPKRVAAPRCAKFRSDPISPRVPVVALVGFAVAPFVKWSRAGG